MNRISDFVSVEGIHLRLEAGDAASALTELSAALAPLARVDRERVRAALQEREALGSTALGHEIAVPHAKLDIHQTVGVLGLSRDGIEFGAADGERTRIFVALVSPLQGGGHLKALAAVARDLADPAFRAKLLEARDPAEAHRLLTERSTELRS